MTPKEKAKELVDKMWIYALPNANGSWKNAKQCALIAVDEILDDDVYDMSEELFEARIKYWEIVKLEIKLL